MKRRLLQLAVLLSIVLGVSAIGLWVASHWYGFKATVRTVTDSGQYFVLRSFAVGSRYGGITISNSYVIERHGSVPRPFPPVPFKFSTEINSFAETPPSVLELHRRTYWRFKHYVIELPDSATQSNWRIPFWAVVPPCAVLPLIHLRRKLRERRERRYAKTGRCVVCGYDLHATPDLCPECGTLVSLD